jgi:hypothetical protein
MEIFTKIAEWFASTHIHEQIMDVDYVALGSNPWFMVPFVLLLCYLVFKQRWKDIVVIGICGVVWWVSGTAYMDTLIIGDELQIEKILPIVFGGAACLGLVIYLLFGRSD